MTWDAQSWFKSKLQRLGTPAKFNNCGCGRPAGLETHCQSKQASVTVGAAVMNFRGPAAEAPNGTSTGSGPAAGRHE